MTGATDESCTSCFAATIGPTRAICVFSGGTSGASCVFATAASSRHFVMRSSVARAGPRPVLSPTCVPCAVAAAMASLESAIRRTQLRTPARRAYSLERCTQSFRRSDEVVDFFTVSQRVSFTVVMTSSLRVSAAWITLSRPLWCARSAGTVCCAVYSRCAASSISSFAVTQRSTSAGRVDNDSRSFIV